MVRSWKFHFKKTNFSINLRSDIENFLNFAMETYKIRTRIKENHKLMIEDLPFEKGEEVEVMITQKSDI